MKNKKTLKDFTLHIGLNSDEEVTQLITVDGWHVANIEHFPHREIAERVVCAVNSHEKLVEALSDLLDHVIERIEESDALEHMLDCPGEPDCVICNARAALALAGK